jgi:hypothetical protein
MASWKKIYSYGDVLQISSVNPDKYNRFVKVKVNDSTITLDKDDIKKLTLHLIEKYL